MDQITAALSAHRPQVLAQVEGHVRRAFASIARHQGTLDAGTIDGRRSFREMPYVHEDLSKAHLLVNVHPQGQGSTYRLNEDRLLRHVEASADAILAAWAAKITAKLKDLDGAELVRGEGMDFFLRGTREGRAVEIHQTMILNTSVHGRLFNQFPARIRLDGKATSEAAYKKAF